jgi:uncharacterized membrane protein
MISGTPAATAAKTIQEVVALEQREKVRMTISDHIADGISSFAGSMVFVALHVVWFCAWILLGFSGLGFDPFPFNLLTMTVSLEAIFLSTFVLISENRQAVLSEKRAKLDLQVNMISEQEVTKLISMVARISEHLGISFDDPEVQHMQEPTHVRNLADHMEKVEASVNGDAAKTPDSAVETQP